MKKEPVKSFKFSYGHSHSETAVISVYDPHSNCPAKFYDVDRQQVLQLIKDMIPWALK